MSNPTEMDVETQPTQATDLALENLMGELDGDPTRTVEDRTRTGNGRGDVSPSPDSFQVLTRTTPSGTENTRNLTESQMIRDRELLSIMEDISETTARSSGRSVSVVAESRVGTDMVGLADFGRRSASDSAGRSAGIENRTAVGHHGNDRNRDDENRTAVGRTTPDRNREDENRTAIGRIAPDRSPDGENRTAVGREVHGRSET